MDVKNMVADLGIDVVENMNEEAVTRYMEKHNVDIDTIRKVTCVIYATYSKCYYDAGMFGLDGITFWSIVENMYSEIPNASDRIMEDCGCQCYESFGDYYTSEILLYILDEMLQMLLCVRLKANISYNKLQESSELIDLSTFELDYADLMPVLIRKTKEYINNVNENPDCRYKNALYMIRSITQAWFEIIVEKNVTIFQ
jgi:hypothetical protein